MLYHELANLLLYVPFNHEYPVSESIQNKLTVGEFYTKCYYNPKFEEEIRILKSLTEEASADLDYPINRSTMIDILQRHAGDENMLKTWIKNNDTGVYCIAGDAGTGKSTFLHHLEYTLDSHIWSFIDLQRAVSPIPIMGYSCDIPNFGSLSAKIQAVILQQLTNSLFVRDTSHVFNYTKTRSNIKTLLNFYRLHCANRGPKNEVAQLYSDLASISSLQPAKRFCSQCASTFSSYFSKIITHENEANATAYILEHYLISLWQKDMTRKHIIVLDNLERYIGTDEIFNDQIVMFFNNLRGIRDAYSEKFRDPLGNVALFPKHFQFIIAMRNTTIRMFTPQQNADFLPHKIDISDWFPIDRILSKKIAWYQENTDLHYFSLNSELLDRLNYILSDQGCTGEILRGLRLKLNMLFNNDKRLLADFLIDALSDKNNIEYLDSADIYRKNTAVNESLRKFAYRSIIWRIVFNKLRQGPWFQHVFALDSDDDVVTELDYARKILTILSNHALEQPEGGMAFNELLSQLYPGKTSIKDWFYSPGCELERTKIAQILYSMNYYERRKNNWFQFIDVQCNSQDVNGRHLKDVQCFKATLLQPSVSDEITIQITTSGKAYLGYIVQSFEFISCICGNTNPMLTVVPSVQNLMSSELDALPCVVTANSVFKYCQILCKYSCSDLQTKHDVLYRKNLLDHGSSYATRIKYAQRGFLNNFCELFDETIISDDPTVITKKEALISKLRKISTAYETLGNPPKPIALSNPTGK